MGGLVGNGRSRPGSYLLLSLPFLMVYQLNQRAFDLLKAEIERCCVGNPAGQVQQAIALQRLERLRTRAGQPLRAKELGETLNDLFPKFDQQVLQRAAKANCPPSPFWGRLKLAAIATVSLVGGVAVLNLPYPMIRYPVARTIPLVLLPSFMSMDHHYREAIAATEQADQLVNQATSAADLKLGATKVNKAQTHLDALPVWFLGYYPRSYCSLFQCRWQFTRDEFEQARKGVARMQARLFQEDNAQTQLSQAEQALLQAQQQYQSMPDVITKQTALAAWQQAIDTLQTVPQATLAGRTAQTKLVAYERDFQAIAGFTNNNLRTGRLMQAAKLAAETAQTFSSRSIQTAAEWEKAEKLWAEAIAPLATIKEEDPDYIAAQSLLQTYTQQQATVSLKRQAEAESVRAYEQAQSQTQQFLAALPEQPKALQSAQKAQLRGIIATLEKVQPGTTVHADAQAMLKSAKRKLP